MGMEHRNLQDSGRSAVWRSVRFASALLMAGAFGALAVQCSASSNNQQQYPGYGSGGSGNSGNSSGFDASATGGSGGTPVINVPDSGAQDVAQDAFYVNDPPPADCSDGGAQPPVITGTPQCPSDKNNAGCPCPNVGDTAACWPGYRKNRNQGDCKDGTTTCVLQGENQPVWGPCVGYSGIDSQGNPLGTSGSAACGCFSHGLWSITNLSPCFGFTDSTYTNAVGAVSTVMSGGDGGSVQCPSSASQPNYWNNPTAPGSPWSTDTVSADCTGYFKLCYTLKALSASGAKPAAGDCVMKQVCTEAHYDVANKTQQFPPLPAWVTNTPAEKSCAGAFVKNGGYAEMSVDGTSDQCEKVSKVFQTVTYCPQVCNTNPSAPGCANCTNGGGGTF